MSNTFLLFSEIKSEDQLSHSSKPATKRIEHDYWWWLMSDMSLRWKSMHRIIHTYMIINNISLWVQTHFQHIQDVFRLTVKSYAINRAYTETWSARHKRVQDQMKVMSGMHGNNGGPLPTHNFGGKKVELQPPLETKSPPYNVRSRVRHLFHCLW